MAWQRMMDVLDYVATFELQTNEPPSITAMTRFVEKLDFILDADFKTLVTRSDGASGPISKTAYLQVWTLEEMVDLNPYYDNIPACNDLFFFGSDGSNVGYAFVKTSGEVVSIDFLDLGQVDPLVVADSFADFLKSVSDEAGES